jgi:hypothetical protein
VKEKVWLLLKVLELNVADLIWCGTWSSLVQTTVVPFLTVSEVGLKAKFWMLIVFVTLTGAVTGFSGTAGWLGCAGVGAVFVTTGSGVGIVFVTAGAVLVSAWLVAGAPQPAPVKSSSADKAAIE